MIFRRSVVGVLMPLATALGAMACVRCASSPRVNLAKVQAAWGGAATISLQRPFYDPDVLAICDPPVGWKPEPLKINSNHTHQVWLSPSGHTAYGVIHFKLPLPVGQEIALSGFLDHMKTTEGEATLLSRRDDPELPGIQFVAQSTTHVIYANFQVESWEGWAVYVGVKRGFPVNREEFDQAERARDHTRVGQLESSTRSSG